MQWKILVVDDEGLSCEMVKEVLQRNGYLVLTAPNGEDAMRILRQNSIEEPIDLVITDVAMPGMNGVELAEWINNELPTVGVIVMTAVGSKETILRLMRSGVCDYIDKPFLPEDMLSLVEKTLVGGERPGVVGELHRLHEELEDLVAAEVDKQRAEMVRWIRGGLRHRFNQPLTILIGNIAFLKRILALGKVEASVQEVVSEVLEEMRGASHCMRDLLKMVSSLKTLESTPYVGSERILDLENSSRNKGA